MSYEYRIVTLAEIADDLSDGLHKAPEFVVNGEYLFVNATNLENGHIVEKDKGKRTTYEEYCKYGVPLTERTILYSIDGTIGNIARYRGEKCVLGKGACYITVKSNIDIEYVYYQLQSPHFKSYINSMSTGSTIKHISLKTMRNYSFPLPELEIQKKISSVLSVLDNKIELNQRINWNLERQAQALFQSWFSDEKKANGCLADMCQYSKDKIAVSELDLETYYSTENMLPGKAGATQATNLPTTTQTTKCKAGNVLISNIRPYFKKIVYCYADCGCSTDVLCFVPKKQESSAYLFFLLYDDAFFDFMVAGSKGTKMPRGDKQQIMMYPVYVPLDEELARFNSIAQPVLNQIQLHREENRRLVALRDALLPKLMAGEIDLQEV